jgi:hypothetical protein
MLNEKLRRPFIVRKQIKGVMDEGGTYQEATPVDTTLYGVVSRLNSSETEGVGVDVLSRQKRIRVFGVANVSYDDTIILDGEEWEIMGEPETIHAPMRQHMKSTVIDIFKQGRN